MLRGVHLILWLLLLVVLRRRGTCCRPKLQRELRQRKLLSNEMSSFQSDSKSLPYYSKATTSLLVYERFLLAMAYSTQDDN